MKGKIARTIQVSAKVLEWTVCAVMMVIFLILVSPLLPTKNTFSTCIISTGSMEPTIAVGTVAITRPLEASDVREEMIISFASPVDVETTIMHRVTEVREDNGSLSFRTKGDNNNAEDNWIVQPEYIQGELVYQVPYIGHLVAFVQTPLGFGIAIGIPALLLVLAQIRRIKQGIEEEVEKRLKKAAAKTQTATGILILFVMANAMLAVVSIKTMYAWFTTSAQVHGIMISIKDFVPPPVPAHIAPTDGSILQSTSILFDWSDEEDYEDHHNPVYYILQIGADSGFSTIVYTSSELGTSQTPPPGIGDGTYFWRVKACDAIDNCSEWSTGWEITIDDTAPSTPIWIRPADGSTTRQSQHMLFDWTDSTDANLVGYEYENRKGAAAPWRSIDTCGLLTVSQIPNPQVGPGGSCISANAATLSSDGQYFRRVRAVDAAGNYSSWSPEWMITKDLAKPTSSVNPFSQASTSATSFDVFYTSSDVGAGEKKSNYSIDLREVIGHRTGYLLPFNTQSPLPSQIHRCQGPMSSIRLPKTVQMI